MSIEKRPDESVTAFTVRRIRAEIIEECAKVAEGMPQLVPTSPEHVRQLSGVDVAKAIRALASGEGKVGG